MSEEDRSQKDAKNALRFLVLVDELCNGRSGCVNNRLRRVHGRSRSYVRLEVCVKRSYRTGMPTVNKGSIDVQRYSNGL